MVRRKVLRSQRTLEGRTVRASMLEEEWQRAIKNPNERVVCPYCMYEGRLIEFRTEKKEGYSSRMFHCPDCGEGMRGETLTREMTVSEYGRWLREQVALWHAYTRISWEKLFERLRAKGWAREFWAAYRAAKGGRETSELEDEDEYRRTAEWNCPRTNEPLKGPCKEKCENNKDGLCIYPKVVINDLPKENKVHDVRV